MKSTISIGTQNFAAIKGVTYEAAREGIIQSLIRLYTKYAWIKNCEFMSEQDQQFFNSVNFDMTDTTAALAVNALCDYLSRYYGTRTFNRNYKSKQGIYIF